MTPSREPSVASRCILTNSALAAVALGAVAMASISSAPVSCWGGRRRRDLRRALCPPPAVALAVAPALPAAARAPSARSSDSRASHASRTPVDAGS